MKTLANHRYQRARRWLLNARNQDRPPSHLAEKIAAAWPRIERNLKRELLIKAAREQHGVEVARPALPTHDGD